MLPVVAGQRDVGQPVGDGDADLGAGRLQVGFGGPHVRTLLDQLRRQADRQIARQPQCGEHELLRQSIARKAAAQRRQQVALLRQLLLQRRQGLLHLRQRRLLRHDIGLGDLAKLALTPQQPEHVGLDLDDAAASPRSGRAAKPPARPRRPDWRSESDRSPRAAKRWESACAASASIERRVPPNTSGA